MRCVAPGDVVGGQFRLISEIAQGGMGTVWRAHHLKLRSDVAVKLIDPVIALDPQALRRFLCEARTAAALRSPHIVQILDYGVDGDRPYIAMEMLEGESLAAHLERSGRLGGLETARVIRHVARALGRAHDAGIVHRDLKPENIFVVKNDDEMLIKVLDFGIAKARLPDATLSVGSLATRTGAVMGTPHFMSPEQAEALASVDFRADLWALGVVAFDCLLGELPFKGNSITQVVLAICRDPLPIPSQIGPVPNGFDAWFARACARNPDERFESAKQAADALERLDSTTQGVPESRRSAPPISVAASNPRALDTGAGYTGTAATQRSALRRRVLVTTVAGLLLSSAGIGLLTERFQSTEATAIARSLRPASSAAASRATVSADPEPQLLLNQALAAPPVEPGGRVFENNGREPASSTLADRAQLFAATENSKPSSGAKQERTAGAVRGDTVRSATTPGVPASRRPSKSPSQRAKVQKLGPTRSIDLGF